MIFCFEDLLFHLALPLLEEMFFWLECLLFCLVFLQDEGVLVEQTGLIEKRQVGAGDFLSFGRPMFWSLDSREER